MAKSKIRIYFCDFWENFEKDDNLFVNLLRRRYDVEITPDNPDYLFYSYFGNSFTHFNCTRIFFTGENVRPDFSACDYAITFDLVSDNPRHYRLPLYALFDDVELLTHPKDPEELLRNKSKFCNFIYSNPNSRKRIDFFKQLSKYKKVDSGGRVLNNIGERVGNKLEFINDYKFTIAFENEGHPGYTTEKLFEPMLAGSLPIYWGNPKSGLDFNTKSFINYHDFGSDEEVIDHIIEVDNNDDLYLKYMSEPWFSGNRVNPYVDNDNVLGFLSRIIDNDITPVSSSSPLFHSNPLIRNISRFSNSFGYKSRHLVRKYVLNFNINKVVYRLKRMKARTG